LPKDESPLVNSLLVPHIWGVGPLLILQYRNDLWGIAPLNDHGEPRPQVLWRLPLIKIETGNQDTSRVEANFRLRQPPPGFGVLENELTDSFQQRTGQVGIVTAGMLVYQTGGRLVAIDPATGRTLWSRSQLPTDSTVMGDGSHVVLVHQNNSRVTVLRAMDGRVRAKRDVPTSGQLLTWWGCRALLQEESEQGIIFKLWDAAKNRTLWKQDAPAKTMAFGVDSERWGFLTSAGELTLLDTGNGQALAVTKLKSVTNPDQVYALADDQRIYLGISHKKLNSQAPAKSPILDDLPFRHPLFAGTLHAFNRRTGKAVWHTGWDHWALSLEQPATGPVLVLFHREKAGNDKKRSVLRCLEKRTGREIFSGRFPETDEPPRWEENANQQEFEIQAFQTTLRLRYE
ncbi:MAG: PQQ-binding-like beta-propeller repeat protein, partial [Planctomycetaceae bacterium]|nr:PQQ-binding-like beta-propeller repeat protein [Planctomycetaceae bacterium]